MASKDTNNLMVLAHLSGFAGLVVPLGSILGPLIMWLIYKEKNQSVASAAKEALNFQITWLAILFLCALSMFVLVGLLLFPAAIIAWIVLMVLAAMAASQGRSYTYPLTLRLIN